MLVSVIIPNYNHAPFLKQRIDSVLNQSYQSFEVILLDDASTDNSWEILQSYESHEKVSHCLRNERNSGSPFIQWQKGIELAKGEWIWIAESDDLAELEFLTKILNFHNNANEVCGLLYTQSFDVDESGKIIANRLYWTQNFEPNIWEKNWIMSGQKFLLNYLNKKNVIPNASAVVFKKSLCSKVDWNQITKMNMCGDWLFWAEITSDTSVGFVTEPLNYFRIHKNVSRNHSDEKKKRNRVKEEFIFRKKLKLRWNIPFEKKFKLQKGWFELGFTFTDLFNKTIYEVNYFNSKLELVVRFIHFKYLK